MRRTVLLSSVAVGLFLTLRASPACGQDLKSIPTISSRYFVSGSARVTVTGSFQIDEDVAINAKASFGDGEKTWLQFGISGSPAPNVLVTYGLGEDGIIVGRGKLIATAPVEQCKGKVEVTATSVSGEHTCVGIGSYDPASGRMGKVDIKVRFSAKS